LLFNSCSSSYIQSVRNISLVVRGIGVDDDDEKDDDDDDDDYANNETTNQ